MDSLLGRILKLIFGSIVVGLFSGLIIPRVINAFSSDGSFELLELWLTFLIIIITTNILVFLVRFLTHHLSRIIAIKPHIDCNFTQFKFLSIPGVLTGIIPMGGGLFGGLGNEPIWEYEEINSLKEDIEEEVKGIRFDIVFNSNDLIFNEISSLAKDITLEYTLLDEG